MPLLFTVKQIAMHNSGQNANYGSGGLTCVQDTALITPRTWFADRVYN